MTATYTVGIDLGTTHTVVAYAAAKGRIEEDAIRLFDVEQLVAPGEVAARPLLPSMRYHPAPGELPPGDLVLPWVPAGEGEPYAGTLRRTSPLGYLPQDPREGNLDVIAKDRVLSARGLDELLRDLEKAQTAMAEHVDRNLWLRKIPARMFLIIAPLLLALVSMGIYAVVSYTVAHRTSEIGIRIALGATSRAVVRQIVKEGMTVIGAGALLAWMLALLVDFHLFAGGVADLPVLVGVPVLLLAVAWVACWVPARRATLVDASVALRSE